MTHVAVTHVAVTHLVLVGMMASGKTTVARLAAARLNRPFLDSDAMIEQQTGRTVRDIFRTDGEAAFRALETKALNTALAGSDAAVIAAAGGVVLSAQNRALLKDSSARVIWLCAEPATLLQRLEADDHRPLLDADPAGTLQFMFLERDGLYREVADVIIDVNERSVDDVVDEVVAVGSR